VNVPIVFRGPNGAAAGVAAQHSQCFAAWYSHCPGLKVRSLNKYLMRRWLLRSVHIQQITVDKFALLYIFMVFFILVWHLLFYCLCRFQELSGSNCSKYITVEETAFIW